MAARHPLGNHTPQHHRIEPHAQHSTATQLPTASTCRTAQATLAVFTSNCSGRILAVAVLASYGRQRPVSRGSIDQFCRRSSSANLTAIPSAVEGWSASAVAAAGGPDNTSSLRSKATASYRSPFLEEQHDRPAADVSKEQTSVPLPLGDTLIDDSRLRTALDALRGKPPHVTVDDLPQDRGYRVGALLALAEVAAAGTESDSFLKGYKATLNGLTAGSNEAAVQGWAVLIHERLQRTIESIDPADPRGAVIADSLRAASDAIKLRFLPVNEAGDIKTLVAQAEANLSRALNAVTELRAALRSEGFDA